MSFSDFKTGVGLRVPFYEIFWQSRPKNVHWVEVISENYMLWPDKKNTRPLAKLTHIRKNVPIALHGVSMSIGSTDPLNKAYLKSLKNLIETIEPIAVSDHLCWTGVNKHNTHDLLPVPYTTEALFHIRDRILRVQDFLKRRILIENVSSYVEFDASEMMEWDFLRELSKQTDCGILLDINNVYVSSVNHGFNALRYLEAIPADRVGQIHLAGHLNKGTHIIDTHDSHVCDDVWALYAWWVKNNGLQSTMVEWDSKLPPWKTLHREVKKAAEIRTQFKQKDSLRGKEQLWQSEN